MLCGNSVFPCKQGVRTCSNGTWSAECVGETKPTMEICDGIDNDCDGTTDQLGDSLCPAGQYCFGAQKCGGCRNDNDCTNVQAAMCHVAYCDASSHTCKQRSADNGVTCDGSRKCSAGSCVDCVSDGDCGSGKRCSSGGKCEKIAKCGDNVIDVGEQCDNGASNSDNSDCTSQCKSNVCGDGHWNRDGATKEACDLGDKSNFADGRKWDSDSCTVSCSRIYVYTPCSSASDCGVSGVCSGATGCWQTCSATGACTTSNGRSGMCAPGGGCAVSCSTLGSTDQCPRGSSCRESTLNDASAPNGKALLCLATSL